MRSDGFSIAGVQINGVRTYDPAIGTWITPDAYAGEVHDPASQQRYMFNRNNAYDYEDPSGYCPDACIVEGGVAIGGAEVIVGGSLLLAGAAAATGHAEFSKNVSHFGSNLQDKISSAIGAVLSTAGHLIDQAKRTSVGVATRDKVAAQKGN